MAQNSDSVEFVTSKSLREIEKALQKAYRRAGVESVEQKPGTSSYSVALYGKPAPLSPFVFEVDVTIWSENDGTYTVELEAVDDGGGKYFGTVLTREYGTYRELKASKKRRDIILNELKRNL